jgi:hypothetical protein
MRRLSSVGVLVLGTLLWSVQPAYADFWDWLQEFSGPGPFHERAPNLIIDFCQQPFFSGKLLKDYQLTDKDRLQALETSDTPVICWFADLRFFANNEGDNFGLNNNFPAKSVHVDFYETGASVPLNRAVSLGFGAGLMHISTPTHSGNKAVLAAPRVVIKPLLLYGTNEFWAKKPAWVYAAAGAVKFYVKGNVVLGRLTDADFGGSTSSLNQQYERLASVGFTFDAGPLLAYLNNR